MLTEPTGSPRLANDYGKPPDDEKERRGADQLLVQAKVLGRPDEGGRAGKQLTPGEGGRG